MIYRNSIDSAKRSGEIDLYRESKRANIACKAAIEENIASCFKDNRLDSSGAKAVIAAFGYDRTMWVLAATIRYKEYDGRFSDADKKWARGLIPSYLTDNDIREYAVNSHPTLVDGFTDQVRKEYARLGMLSEKNCIRSNGNESYEKKLLILKPEVLNEQYKNPIVQYFFAQNGFGCYPDRSGDKVFGSFLCDGEQTYFRRRDFLGVADSKQLPKWAQTRLNDLTAPKLQIRIFQLENGDKNASMNYDHTVNHGGVDASHYRQIWGGTMVTLGLEDIFYRCNTDNKPLGYCGHSLSVSDVIEICDGKDKGCYFVDSVGFKQLDDFDIDKTDHDQMLKVLILENDKKPYAAEIRHDIHAMQHIVGGHIEAVYFEPKDNAICWCNEEFLLNGSAPNRVIGQTLVHGACFISGDGCNEYGERDSQSLTDEQIKQFKRQFDSSVIVDDQSEDESEDMSEDVDISIT